MLPLLDTQDIQSSINKHCVNKYIGFSAVSFNFPYELSTESMQSHHSEKLDWFYLFWQRNHLNQPQIYLKGRRKVLKERRRGKGKHKWLLLAFLQHSLILLLSTPFSDHSSIWPCLNIYRVVFQPIDN